MKLVGAHSRPISRTCGLNEIERLIETQPWLNEVGRINEHQGSYQQHNNLTPYVTHLMSYITATSIKPFKIVVNAGNGAAGHVIDEIERQFKQFNIPIQFIKLHHQPDASFPHGIPNPLIVENRQSTINAIIAHNADMGIAWDGDFDRCFLFDETGKFVEGYYIVGLLAQAFLQHESGAKIIHDPRLTWNSIELINQTGGQAVLCKTGHAPIKELMRQENAIYGGEMSAHHYFRDFFYCDSGMIPWLLIVELLSVQNLSLSQAVNSRIMAYPASGEINLTLSDTKQALDFVLAHYQTTASHIDYTDGISMEFVTKQQQWRFNLRLSNTEPVVRLNVESKANKLLMQQKTDEILSLLRQFG
jgi:phosphomannomutase